MTRTRTTFFVILALFLLLAAFSLINQLISNGLLLQLYVATAIFGIGIISLDFLGILGENHSESGGDGMDSLDGHVDGGADGGTHGGIDGSADGGADFVVVDGGVHGGGDLSADLSIDGPGSHVGGTDFDAGDATSGHSMGDGDFDVHNQRRTRPNAGHSALMLMAYLRLCVYFSAGFGPMGWVALSSGRTGLVSLLWASVAGGIALVMAQAFFRFQQSNTDSTLHTHELLRQEATVTIPLNHKDMGKVRVKIGMSVTEQYALASRPDLDFKSGDKVYITRVTDECVYVA